MGLLVLTPAQTFALTSLATVKDELEIDASDPSRDETLSRYIAAASSAIADDLSRVVARQQYRETRAGNGRTELDVYNYPLVGTPTVSLEGSVITDWVVSDVDAGFLYRELTWPWTTNVAGPLDAMGLIPSPGGRRLDLSIDYWAGWLLPDDNRSGNTYSCAASDNSINDSLGTMPLLVPGDLITIGGSVSNNGTGTVVSRTANKVIVSGLTLTDEAEGAAIAVTLTVSTLPAAIEDYCVYRVTERHHRRGRNPYVTRDQVDGRSVHLGGQFGFSRSKMDIDSDPLSPYRRAA
jgi:hypothetical protein